MKKHKKRRPSTCKVRRDVTGGKRGDGNSRRKPVRRPPPALVRAGRSDPNLTGVAGLVAHGVWLREIGVDRELARRFGHLKDDPRVVYPMAGQLRLLMDAFVAGECTVFGVEALAADPLFVRLAGGVVPSLDTLYADLGRFGTPEIATLEGMVAEQGLHGLGTYRGRYVHLDIDTTVCPHDAEDIEGAEVGPNPKYRGRRSHHPILARLSELGTIAGVELRSGDRGLGAEDVPAIRTWVNRAKKQLRKGTELCVRIDSGGDCAEILEAIGSEEAFYVVKARITQELFGALTAVRNWRTTDRDADNRAMRQVAEIPFTRGSWLERGVAVRVIAVRSLDRHGRQLPLPGTDCDWTVQVFLTNRVDNADDVAWDYDGRAGVEPLIAELKNAWSIGVASSTSFAANHVVLLLKTLCHNLLSRYARANFPLASTWRTPWRRRLLIRVPGRLSTSGRKHFLHVLPGSVLVQRE